MKAVIIGASSEALHTIKAAHDNGLYVTALDGNPNAEGLKTADKGLVVDISQEQAVIEAVREEKADFALTVPIGRYLTTSGAVNDALGLPGISRQMAVLCTDKYKFHRKLQEQRLRESRCYAVGGTGGLEPEEIRRRIADGRMCLDFPAILKPRFGSGSRGVQMIKDGSELEKALQGMIRQEAQKVQDVQTQSMISPCGQMQEERSRISGSEVHSEIHAQAHPEAYTETRSKAYSETYVLEECVPGEEYGVDGAVIEGVFYMVLLRRKENTPPPARQAVAYFSVLPEDAFWQQAQDYMKSVVNCLGLNECLLHADLIWNAKGPFVIELSARPSGHNLHNLFTPLCTGIDMAAEYIRYRMGRPWNFTPAGTRQAVIHYFDMKGKVMRVPEEEQVRQAVCSLIGWECHIREGDELNPVSDGHSLMGRGYFILEGEEKRLRDDIFKVKALFQIV